MRNFQRFLFHFVLVQLALSADAALATPPVQDGLLDTGFGGDGVVSWTGGSNNSVELADAVATDDGTLIGVGAFTAGSAAPTLHFQAWTANGTLSPHACYGTSSDLIPLSTESRGRTAIIDSTGNLLVGGSANFLGSETIPRALLARFALDQNGCALDSSFSTNGWELFDDPDYCADGCLILDLAEIRPATGAVTAPRIVALLQARIGPFSSRLLLVALAPNGALESSFGVGGFRVLAASGLGPIFPNSAHLGIDPRGRIYVFASHYNPEATLEVDLFLARLTPGGDLDATFGTGGIQGVQLPDNDGIDTLAADFDIRSDGSIVLSAQPLSFEFNWYCLMLPPASPYCGESTGLVIPAALHQGDGKLLYAFETSGADGVRIGRFIGDLAFDPDFGPPFEDPPQLDLDLGGANGENTIEMVLAAGRPVLAGTADATAGRSAGFLARLTNSYLFADGFEGGSPALWSAVFQP